MSMRIVGDTEAVATNAQWLNRSIAGLLLLLVTVAGVLTYRGLRDSSNADETVEPGELNPEGAERTYSGQELVIEDLEFPLTLSCVPVVGSTEVYVVIMTNDGNIEADYLVAAELVSDDGDVVQAMAEVNDLRPQEVRESVLVPDEDLDAIDGCSITAIQGNRRVLLNR
jgi:hypothetical protein